MIRLDNRNMAMPLLLIAFAIAAAQAQSITPPTPAANFQQVVDRAIGSERGLMDSLRSRQPIVETYVQELQTDEELGAVPERDFYFLGKLDLHNGVELASFMPVATGMRKTLRSFLARFIPSNEFFPRGFASRIFVDADFNRSQYSFTFVRREFLGDVRCVVMDVHPLGKSKGRFLGRVWVEDRGYNVVRFSGSYGAVSRGYLHFDSWRVNAGPGLWLPAAIYTEESSFKTGLRHNSIVRAQTRLWDYESQKGHTEATFTNLEVDIPQGVKDQSDTEDPSPVEALRLWQRQAEDNVLNRLQAAGLISPAGDVENVLNTVVSNLEVTNNIDIQPAVRVRVMPTSPLESLSVGNTIVLSRGLLDVLPDEACLAAVLSHELAHVVLAQTTGTHYAFADRLMFDDPDTLKNMALRRTEDQEEAADAKALQLLSNSPYKDKLPRVGLFLRMLSERSNELPHLIRPLLGNGLADAHQHLRLAALVQSAPELQVRNTAQVAALPLGSRVHLDPWSNQLRLIRTATVPLLAASEKRPFELTPIMLHLKRQNESGSNAARVPAVPAASAELATGSR